MGDDEHPTTGWTPDLLKVHYDAVLKARDEETERTRRQMELRLDGMNEFRDSLNDLTRQFVTRNELRSTVIAVAAFTSAVAAVVVAVHP